MRMCHANGRCAAPSPAPLQNKVIFNYFPYPWFVSTVHVVVGALYCIVAYVLGAKKASFERVRATVYRALNRLAGAVLSAGPWCTCWQWSAAV